MSIKILSVVGARPNFMKIAAICEAIREYNATNNSLSIDHVLVHTGQHYDANMSDTCSLTISNFPPRICFWESVQDLTRFKQRKSWSALKRFFWPRSPTS